ncbi:MAG: hypothetical protein MEP44_02710, partial [Blastomonas sp.]|nr:hypothetical protein [Blastomonas sp.]
MTFRNLLTSREGPSLARIAPFALSSLISASVGLASLAAFTRILAPSQVGQYVALLAFIVLFQSVGFFWLQNGLLRAYSKCRDDVAKAHLVSATKMGFALASAMVSAAWLGFAFFSGRILPIELWLVGLPLLLLGGWTAIT